MRPEIHLKASALEFLLPQLQEGEVIGSEILHAEGRGKVDLMIASRERLVAIEIKSATDDFRRLSQQLDRYDQMFHSVNIWVEENHLQAIRSIAPKTTGIVIFTNERVKPFRSARERKFISKQASLAWLSRKEKERLMKSSHGHFSSTFKDTQTLERKLITGYTRQELQSFACRAVTERLSYRFQVFTSFLGKTISSEDVINLSSPDKIHFF